MILGIVCALEKKWLLYCLMTMGKNESVTGLTVQGDCASDHRYLHCIRSDFRENNSKSDKDEEQK